MSTLHYTGFLLIPLTLHSIGPLLIPSALHSVDIIHTHSTLLNHLALPHSSLFTLDRLSQDLHFANFLIKMFCMSSKHFILPLSSPSGVSLINAITNISRFQIQIFRLFLYAPCNNSTNYSSKSATTSPKNSDFWVEFSLLNANQKIRTNLTLTGC